MTQGAPDSPVRGPTGADDSTMSNKNHQRGEKRGVLSTGRAKALDTEDADADADADAADDDDAQTEG